MSTDTQWRLYQVFEQKSAGEPHQSAGAVHEPDAELAMCMARDVFVRRPQCISLWVVPDAVVVRRTSSQLEESAPEDESGRQTCAYVVFGKSRARGEFVFLETLESPSAVAAIADYAQSSHGATSAWLAFAESDVSRSAPADYGSFFEPVLTKNYRALREYRADQMMHEIRSRKRTK